MPLLILLKVTIRKQDYLSIVLVRKDIWDMEVKFQTFLSLSLHEHKL
jgi:hypothetical protein